MIETLIIGESRFYKDNVWVKNYSVFLKGCFLRLAQSAPYSNWHFKLCLLPSSYFLLSSNSFILLLFIGVYKHGPNLYK